MTEDDNNSESGDNGEDDDNNDETQVGTLMMTHRWGLWREHCSCKVET